MNEIQKIEDLISVARIPEALLELKKLCKAHESENYDTIIVLSAQFNSIQKKERIGLGEFNVELNTIIKAMLSVLAEERQLYPQKSESISTQEEVTLEKLDDRLTRIEHKLEKLILATENNPDIDFSDQVHEHYWRHLESESKIYLGAAEKGMSVEGILDYSSAIIQYSKVLENEFVNKIFLPLHADSEDHEKGYEKYISWSFNKILQEIMAGLSEVGKDTEMNKTLHKTFSIISGEKLKEDLQHLISANYRNRAAHVGILTKKEAADCQELTISILKNLMNRPFKVG